MFGMGGSEILVILIVALLFLGPDKLPEAAKQISKGIRDIKKQSRVLQQTIEDDENIGGAIRDLRSALRGEEAAPVRKPMKPKELPESAVSGAIAAGADAIVGDGAAADGTVTADGTAIAPRGATNGADTALAAGATAAAHGDSAAGNGGADGGSAVGNGAATVTHGVSAADNGGAHGGSTVAHGDSTVAHGGSTVAHGDATVAHGDSTVAHGDSTVAHGDSTVAHGGSTVAHGDSTVAHGGSTVAHGGPTDGNGAAHGERPGAAAFTEPKTALATAMIAPGISTDDAKAAREPKPAITMPPSAGERDPDVPHPTEEDDAALAALVKPATGTVAKGATAVAATKADNEDG